MPNHSVASIPGDFAGDVPWIYADDFYEEALLQRDRLRLPYPFVLSARL